MKGGDLEGILQKHLGPYTGYLLQMVFYEMVEYVTRARLEKVWNPKATNKGIRYMVVDRVVYFYKNYRRT